MTPEQRLDRAERILVRMVQAGRRTRSEWRYKINSLIDAQMQHEVMWRAESKKIDEQIEATNQQIKEVAVAQAQNEKRIANLAKEHELTEKALRAFINSLRKGHNGK